MPAVIFDCDGVLVDTESMSARAWREVTGRYGYPWSDEDTTAALGRSEMDTYLLVAGRVRDGRSVDGRLVDARHEFPAAADFLPELEELRAELIRQDLPVFPDAVAAVRGLVMNGVPLGVASSSSSASLRLKLGESGLAPFFDAVAAGDEVAAAKPAPDVYLLVAGRLGVDPATCLAVEDTEVGATAADAAGMRVAIVVRDGGLVPGRTTVSSLDSDLLAAWL